MEFKMETEINKQIVRKVIEAGLSSHNLELFGEFFDPSYQENQFGLKTTIAGAKQDFESLFRAFPDYKLVIEDMAAEGDRVWLRMTATGTNRGGFMGAPNGKSFKVTVIDILRLKNGKVVEHWGVPDRFHLLAQLGLLPGEAARP